MLTKIEILNRLIETAAETRLSMPKRTAALQAYKAVKSSATQSEVAEYYRANEAARLGVLVEVVA